MRTSALSRPGSRARHAGARVAFIGTAAAVALSLMPVTSAAATTAAEPDPATGDTTATSTATTTDGAETTETSPETSTAAAAPDLVVVRLRVADRAVERVSVKRGVWPATLLRDRGVRTDGNDLIIVKRDGRKVRGEKRRLRAGDRVKVVDVRHRTRVKKVRKAPRTITRATTTLKPGRREVVAEGRPAVHRVKVRRTLHNDELVERKVVARKVVRKAKPRRVLVGRKVASVPGTAGLNWAGLARCESGGNPRAVNPSGYYGLYQFNVTTWRSVGGSGMPHHATAAQQTFRAKLLYKARGAQPWPYCGRYL